MTPHLISFALCPYVQRAVVVLREKGVAYDLTLIDLANKPSWFLEISPLGKVPVLRVGDVSVFESAVIMEYLDEVHPPQLHPADPLAKALHRGWIEFASMLLVAQYQWVTATDDTASAAAAVEIRKRLTQLESQVRGPCFAGEAFGLVDAAFAPFFVRLALLEDWFRLGMSDGLPRVQAWSLALLARTSVRDSTVPDLPQRYRDRLGPVARNRLGSGLS
jgi:glutathione S-transferase